MSLFTNRVPGWGYLMCCLLLVTCGSYLFIALKSDSEAETKLTSQEKHEITEAIAPAWDHLESKRPLDRLWHGRRVPDQELEEMLQQLDRAKEAVLKWRSLENKQND